MVMLERPKDKMHRHISSKESSRLNAEKKTNECKILKVKEIKQVKREGVDNKRKKKEKVMLPSSIMTSKTNICLPQVKIDITVK